MFSLLVDSCTKNTFKDHGKKLTHKNELTTRLIPQKNFSMTYMNHINTDNKSRFRYSTYQLVIVPRKKTGDKQGRQKYTINPKYNT